jgi:hypothetical protein
MFIHLGNRKIISDKIFIGIFNVDTLLKSEYNDWIFTKIHPNDKCVAISEKNIIISSKVNSATIIKRSGLLNKTDFFWRKQNV